MLQYGSTCAGNWWCLTFGGGNGGNYWQMADWAYGGNFGSIESAIDDTDIHNGDNMWSEVYMTSATEYEIQWYDSTSGWTGWLYADLTGSNSGATFAAAQPAVLEAYNISYCLDYPFGFYDGARVGLVWFQNNWLQQAGPNWDSWNDVAMSASS